LPVAIIIHAVTLFVCTRVDTSVIIVAISCHKSGKLGLWVRSAQAPGKQDSKAIAVIVIVVIGATKCPFLVSQSVAVVINAIANLRCAVCRVGAHYLASILGAYEHAFQTRISVCPVTQLSFEGEVLVCKSIAIIVYVVAKFHIVSSHVIAFNPTPVRLAYPLSFQTIIRVSPIA
jgi:hypothetical protein